jgi:putative sigma-54 modulation protein
VLSVDKLRQQITANLHIRGKEIHAECADADMYAAIDALADKLDRQVLRHKEKRNGSRHEPAAIKHAAEVRLTGKTRTR